MTGPGRIIIHIFDRRSTAEEKPPHHNQNRQKERHSEFDGENPHTGQPHLRNKFEFPVRHTASLPAQIPRRRTLSILKTTLTHFGLVPEAQLEIR